MDITISIPDEISNILENSKAKLADLQEYGLSFTLAKFYSKVWNQKINLAQGQIQNNSTDVESSRVKIKQEYKKDKGTLEVKSLTITTLEEALEVAQIDLDVWTVDRSIVNSWGVTMKINDEPVYRTNYQVKVFLKIRITNTIEETFKEFFKKLSENKTIYTKLSKKKKPQYMLECGLVDHHFGMLAWAKETLSDYDLKIAELLYVESVKRAISRIPNPDQIAKIIIPIGHDFFHINDQSNQTPRAGHRLDVDGRVPKVYATGKMAAIKAINYCKEIAPVEVVYVSGNHDPQMGYFLCDTVASWFKDCSDVKVDLIDGIVNPTQRKYRQWGRGMLGMSHGLDEKMADLPLIMANEAPQIWADTIYREIHIGHYHKSASYGFKPISNTFTPVIVKILPSLCGADDYSYSHGWLAKGVQAAEFHLWDKDYGAVQYISVKAEEII